MRSPKQLPLTPHSNSITEYTHQCFSGNFEQMNMHCTSSKYEINCYKRDILCRFCVTATQLHLLVKIANFIRFSVLSSVDTIPLHFIEKIKIHIHSLETSSFLASKLKLCLPDWVMKTGRPLDPKHLYASQSWRYIVKSLTQGNYKRTRRLFLCTIPFALSV